MTWGTGSWGLDPWGGGAVGAGSMALSNAYAIANRTVRVVLTSAALAMSPYVTGDALNPSTWQVTRLDTGAAISVLSVLEQTATEFDLSLLTPLGPYLVNHSVAAPGLLDSSGSGIGIPATWTFPGLVYDELSSPDARATFAGANSRDLANRSTPNQGQSPVIVGGTMTVTSAGDYANVSGVEFVKKMILRVLTTPRGAFFHLPDYGTNVRLKEPFPLGQKRLIEQDLTRQVLAQPEVDEGAVTLLFSPATGSLLMSVQARLRATGQKISAQIPLNSGGLVAL